jgi:SnoaL-like domain
MSTAESTANPHLASAGVLVDALAAHDFDGMAAALEPDATMTALLPGGSVTSEGAADICAAFAMWFGNVEEFAVVDVSVGQIGELLQLHWRVRVRGRSRFGAAPMIAEQSVYASNGANARIDHIRLLCSGFWTEP